MSRISKEEYLNDPCEASSLPFWKTEQIEIPDNMSILRDDEFDKSGCFETDVLYFKMIHNLRDVWHPMFSDEFELTSAGTEEFANHITECYMEEGVTAEELEEYVSRDVFDADLWVALRERTTSKIVASGIGEYDSRIGEGTLEWIQVSPEYRHKGFGRVIVCELLEHLSEEADFVTVSGRIDNISDPFALYKACGFEHPVIWHVISK